MRAACAGNFATIMSSSSFRSERRPYSGGVGPGSRAAASGVTTGFGLLHAPVVVVADDAVVPCLFPSSDESTLFVSVAQSKSSLMGTQSIVARSVSAAKRRDSWCDVTVTLSFD